MLMCLVDITSSTDEKISGPTLGPFFWCNGGQVEGDITRMDRGEMEAVQPVTDAGLLAQLEDAIASESKFQAHLKLPSAEQQCVDVNADVTAAIRDGSAHVLRCLKVWYDLPADVLFGAVNLMDRFLTKMKAQPKHMACISVSCFHLAGQQAARQGGPSLDLRDLSVISQCNCTPGDLERMEQIIYSKLNVAQEGFPLTPLSFLRIYQELFLASDLGPVFKEILAAGSRGGDIWQCLEIVVCDATCANFRPSVVALVVLYTQLQVGLEESPAERPCDELVRLVAFAVQLQKISKIPGSTFSACLEAVMAVLRRYNARTQLPYRQQLVWKVSTRTMRVLRPTDRYTLALPTIIEQLDHRSRSGSISSDESSESEKEEGILPSDDWSSVNPATWASQ